MLVNIQNFTAFLATTQSSETWLVRYINVIMYKSNNENHNEIHKQYQGNKTTESFINTQTKHCKKITHLI